MIKNRMGVYSSENTNVESRVSEGTNKCVQRSMASTYPDKQLELPCQIRLQRQKWNVQSKAALANYTTV